MEAKFRYYGGKIPLLRSQNSVTAESKFRYHGGKFPLVRKNNSFARLGPSLPWPLSPSALRPFLSRGVKFFRKKTRRPLACPVKVLTFAPAFRKGGAPGGGRGGPGKKVPGCGKKSLAVPPETLTFAARFPLERGSPGRDGSSGPGGSRRAIFEGIGSNTSKGSRERRVPPRVPRGLCRAPRERRQKSILQRRV